VTISNRDGEAVSNISIIESIEAHMAFTMHLRSGPSESALTLSASVSYAEIGEVDQKSVMIEI
jgi:hypothetical protein